MKPTLYRFLVEERSATQPFVQACWAWGGHLGEAISTVTAAAIAHGFQRPCVCEADPDEASSVPEDAVWFEGGTVALSITRHGFPAGQQFEFPFGVVPSFAEGPVDADEIRAGYRSTSDAGLTSIDVNVAGEQLLEDYLALLREFEPFRVFWIQVHEHWEPSTADELYANEALTTVADIAAVIRAHRASTLRNGFVTLTAYHPHGATNVSISDHKKLAIVTRAADVATKVCRWLEGRGYSTPEPFVTIDQAVHHWHYRDPAGLEREPFVQALLSQGFRRWNPGARESPR